MKATILACIANGSNSSLERSGHDKVRTSRPCAARAQLVR